MTFTQRRRYEAGAEPTQWSEQIRRAIRIGDKVGSEPHLGESGVRMARADVGEARQAVGGVRTLSMSTSLDGETSLDDHVRAP